MSDEDGHKSNGGAPTAAIETLSVGRPLKVLSLMLLIGGIIAFFLATASASWLQTSVVRVGLWEECFINKTDIPEGASACSNNPCNKEYAKLCGFFSISTIILCVIGLLLMIQGMKTIKPTCKVVLYNLSIFFSIVAMILFLVPLVGYPIMFMQEITQHKIMEKGYWWRLGWAYGAGWAGIILVILSCIVLKMDKPTAEIVYREKVCRTGSCSV